ncbi:MAG: hypothetical protein LBV29_00160 [Azoarcus sp.]|jgi:hypothetical protein|nr:hypothetical protein [Azoarcus sp.]
MASQALSESRSAKLEIYPNGDMILSSHAGTAWLSNAIDVSDIGFHFALISVRFSDRRFGAMVRIACGARQKFDASFSGDFNLQEILEYAELTKAGIRPSVTPLEFALV